MAVIKHNEMVAALVKSGDAIIASLTPEKAHVLHMAVGISGEAGELLDAVKKHVIYNKEIDRENVVEELGDLEFYMEGLRQGFNITREETIIANIAKLGVRYAKGYSDAAAQERADKTIAGESTMQSVIDDINSLQGEIKLTKGGEND
jgi:NTP pyrophosphatase (non-canonical NTP hydrolase)